MVKIFFAFVLFFLPRFAGNVSEPEPVVIYFGGDVTLSHRFQETAGDDTLYTFRRWNPQPRPDLFLVNLENPVTRLHEKVEKEYNFRMKPVHLATMKNGGINVVTGANNHAHDYGAEGLLETIRHLDSAGIARVGIGRNLAEARMPAMFSLNGTLIGILGYAGWNFPATDRSPGVAPRDINLIRDDVRQLREKADVVIVTFHWGTELDTVPNSEQLFLGRGAVDAGADIVIGHHPHVLQGIEQYRGKTIAYSLGNFIFGGNAVHSYETALLAADLRGTNIATRLVPVTVKEYQPMIAVGAAAEATRSLVQRRSKQFSQTISFMQE